jgi:hypothetical protein
LGQAENAVAIRSAQVGKDHQPRNLLGIRRRQTDCRESARNERFELTRMKSTIYWWSLGHDGFNKVLEWSDSTPKIFLTIMLCAVASHNFLALLLEGEDLR